MDIETRGQTCGQSSSRRHGAADAPSDPNAADALAEAYTALAEALGRVGSEQAPLLLATLALALIAELPDAGRARALIDQAERLARR